MSANKYKKIGKNERTKGFFFNSVDRLFSNLHLFLFLYLILLAAGAKSQEINQAQNLHQWGAITLFNGLPSENIRAIAQTPDGILWFGTDNGLAKFDGRRISIVAVGDAEKILALKISSFGALWIGTNRGAFIFDGSNFRLIEETRNITITSIFISDKIWLATNQGVIFTVNADENFKPLAVEIIPRETLRGSDGDFLKITGLAKIGDKIIAGTRSRSILLIENNETFETFVSPRPYFINALAQDKQGNTWLGADAEKKTSGFFSVQNLGNLQKTEAETGNVMAIEPDSNGGAWAGTGERGLFHFRGGQILEHFTFENTAGGLRSNNINAIFVDRENVLWLGTNRGVSRFDSSSPFNRTLSGSGNSNFVRTIFRTADGQILAGTNRGLFVLADGNWLESNNFSGKPIYSISENAAHQPLFAVSSGIYTLPGKQIFAGDIRAFANFRGKTFAAVFGRGVIQLETQTQIPADDAPTALFADDEKLWIGTAQNGVFTFDGEAGKQENSLEKLRGAAIRKIKRDDENSLWLAGERGLFRYKNGEIETIVPDEDVRDFVVKGANVWAATLKDGLFHAKFDSRFGWIKSEINVEQGLPSEQIFSILPIENQLFIGTNRGVVTYSPSIVEPKITATRVLSQRLHDAAEITKTINLEFPQNSILIEVAGLSSRTFPEQFQYAFLLKNKNGDILDKKLSNEAQFSPTNLPAGDYSIEARAFNKDLLESEPLIVNFSVARAPFPWTATALGILLAIALVALFWAIVERRRIARKNRELATARFDLANEAERERKRIAQDLHDQTLADLRNLMLMSDKIPAETTKFRSEIESVSTEIRRICEDLSPSVLENVGLVAALEFLLSHTIENYKFSAAEDLEEDLNFSPNTQMQIYRIAQEVLSNLKRHSDAKFVEMKVAVLFENEFVLSIEDDGKFFNPEKTVAKGRGISNIKSRAALIEAEIKWRKSATDHTVFQLHKAVD